MNNINSFQYALAKEMFLRELEKTKKRVTTEIIKRLNYIDSRIYKFTVKHKLWKAHKVYFKEKIKFEIFVDRNIVEYFIEIYDERCDVDWGSVLKLHEQHALSSNYIQEVTNGIIPIKRRLTYEGS